MFWAQKWSTGCIQDEFRYLIVIPEMMKRDLLIEIDYLIRQITLNDSLNSRDEK